MIFPRSFVNVEDIQVIFSPFVKMAPKCGPMNNNAQEKQGYCEWLPCWNINSTVFSRGHLAASPNAE